MKLYIASRFRNKQAVREISAKLRTFNVDCVQTWTEEADGCSRVEAALRDIREIDTADGVLLYTEGCESVPGGMHFEAGYAFGAGRQFIVVGPRVHIFCDLPQAIHFDSIDSAIAALGEKHDS